MRVVCETNTWQPGCYCPPGQGPRPVVYRGEVVGAYHDPDRVSPMLMIWDDEAGKFRGVPADCCKPE